MGGVALWRSSGRQSAVSSESAFEGPRADAELLAGWLRSRLRRNVKLTRRDAGVVQAVWVDGEPVAEFSKEPLGASDLLSAELDQFGRDPVYEEAARSTLRAG